MEQFAVFLLRVHLGFVQVIKPPDPMEQLSIFLLGFHIGFIKFKQSPGPVKQLNMLGYHLGFT